MVSLNGYISFISWFKQYEKPGAVLQMEAEVLRLLQDVETEVDEEEDMEAMRNILKLAN